MSSPDTDLDRMWVAPPEAHIRRRLAWWRDLKFGALVHFSAGAQWPGPESWSLCGEDHPWNRRQGPHAGDYARYKAAYERLPETFDPHRFDARDWSGLMRRAGMRYAVVPTKHHDGFCMWDTARTDYRITGPGVPYARRPDADVFGAFTSALRADGLAVGAYLSKPDWHSDDYWWRRFPTPDRNVNYDPGRYPDRWRRFVEFTHRQVEEITGGYGPIDILWLDGGWVRPDPGDLAVDDGLAGELGDFRASVAQDIDMPGIARIARAHHADTLVVDRTVHGPHENYLTPEQGLPSTAVAAPWESCVTLGRRWHSDPGDTAYKSADEVIRLLVTAVARGGNLLLGVGPTAEGELVPQVRDRLEAVGAWLAVHGHAVYGTRSPRVPERDGVFYTADRDGRTVHAFLPAALARDRRPTIATPGPAADVSVAGRPRTSWSPVPGGVALHLDGPPATGPYTVASIALAAATEVVREPETHLPPQRPRPTPRHTR